VQFFDLLLDGKRVDFYEDQLIHRPIVPQVSYMTLTSLAFLSIVKGEEKCGNE